MAKNIISADEQELMTQIHKTHVDWTDGKYKPGKETPQKDLDKGIKMWNMSEKLDKVSRKRIAQISTNKDLLKVYRKERAAYIRKFGSDDTRIYYFISQGSGFGAEGEAVAEINALLSTIISEVHLGTRSYLLAENFPETIAYAKKILFPGI